ncbi:MAG: hypothetical protein K9H84_08255 [Bacteroidales bacterium]|nr:hypothetical protein [Bacteroidales bacterium]
MKTRLFLISSLILGLLMFSGCGSDSNPMDDLKEASKEIDNIEERSNDLNSPEEAFKILRELNQVMKDVRGAVMSLDFEYKDMSKEDFEAHKQSAEFKQKMAEFEKVNADIDKSLATISKNVEPYKEDKQVKDMLEKLEDILISR